MSLDIEESFREYYPKLRRYFANKGLGEEEARDLAQDTFVKAFKGQKTFENRSSVKTWLFTIGNNELKQFHRKMGTGKRSGQEVSYDEDLGVSTNSKIGEKQAGPLESVLLTEKKQQIREALARLPPQQNQCVKFRAQGCSYKEIAGLMKIGESSVKSYLYQAREKMKTELEDSFDGFDF